jgi:hypothetical protein
VAQGNGYSAGTNPVGFEAAFLSEVRVSAAGTARFAVSADDGFFMGLGPSQGAQPALVSGPQNDLPVQTFIGGYAALAGDNTPHYPDTIYAISIRFPRAGTYPLEFHYNENGTAGLADFRHVCGPPVRFHVRHPVSDGEDGQCNGDILRQSQWLRHLLRAPTTPPLFRTVFPDIDFDPPVGAHPGDPKNAPNCVPATKVNEFTAPFTDVIPQYVGGKIHCTLQLAEGNGYQAFVKPVAFEDTMVSSVQVGSAGNQVFNVSADDGFVAGFGKDAKGATPTYVSGLQNFGGGVKSFAAHLPLMVGDNTGHFPTQIYALIVHFPAPGIYPMEIDHVENGLAATALTFGTAPNTPLASSTGAEMGRVTGTFYANPKHSGTFTPPTQKPLFSKTFGAIDFDSPKGAHKGDPPNAPSCSPGNKVNEKTAPFTDVVPKYGNGIVTCTLQPAAGNGYSAFVKPRAFEDTMVAKLHVDSPGDQTFAISADDGFIAGFGASKGSRPVYISGPRDGFKAGAKTFADHLHVMFGDNRSHLPSVINIVDVNFPAAGTYPLEIDHVENGVGYSALTFGSAADVPFTSTNLG